jgi:hypothetical protein
MLSTRNISNFRKWYKEHEARNDDPTVDTDFVNIFHPVQTRREKGFSNLVYGARKDIGGFLRSSSLNVAADQQAIYELIQNADDSNSSFFSVSYNETYLLCINNGRPFTNSNLSSIINIGDSDKQGEDIGTFGIGFKILHRLLGEDDGLDAIINNYAGPIIFSWNTFEQLEMFINKADIKINALENEDEHLALLLKIVYTCFPTSLNEEIKLKDFDTRKAVFTKGELAAMRSFLGEELEKTKLLNIEGNNLETGSIFFLKLGKDKYKYINNNIENLRSGISYSLNFLNNLRTIYINEISIKKQKITKTFDGCFEKKSTEFETIKPRNLNRDIKFKFAYYKDYRISNKLENSPNLYNFFSMDDEKNGFRFLLHCNAFDMNNDRRKLQQDSQINERLLPRITESFLQYVEEVRVTDNELYYAIYANLLLSKEPVNKPHINNSLFQPIRKYLSQFIPTQKGFSANIKNIKIKNFKTEVTLSELGLENTEWFYWQEEEDKTLIDAALGIFDIEEWNIGKLFVQADLGKLNNWIKNESKENYSLFIKELEEVHLNEEITIRLLKAKIFRFSDGQSYSIKDVEENDDLIFFNSKINGIKEELIILGFLISEPNLFRSDFSYSKMLNIKSDEAIYKEISDRTAEKNTLTAEQKKNLFNNFIHAETKFTGIAEAHWAKLSLFNDATGNIRPLKEMLPASLKTPTWLNQFKVAEEEYFDSLDVFLVKEHEIYKTFIFPNWENIIQGLKINSRFYEDVRKYFDEEKDLPLTTQRFVLVKDENGNDRFVTSEYAFYNNNLDSTKHTLLQHSIYKLTGKYIPKKEVYAFFSASPFYIKDTDFCELQSASAILEINEIKALIEFCITNRETFFEHYYVEKVNKLINVVPKNDTIHQVNVGRDATKFIEKILPSKDISQTKYFKVLPPELSDFKDLNGILSKESFYDLLIDSIGIDNLQEELVDIISYSDPIRRFLRKISTFYLSPFIGYTKESFAYKVLNMACKELTQVQEREEFRNKIIIETKNEPVKLITIQTAANEVKFENEPYILNLSKIFPDSHQNSDYLYSIIQQFVMLNLNEHQLNTLFAITATPDLHFIFKSIPKEIKNASQLAFLILYNKHNKNENNLNLAEYTVETLDKNYNLESYFFYTREHDFLLPAATLSEKYNGIENILSPLPIMINPQNSTELLKEPYFSENEFICPDLNGNLSDEQKLSLIEYIFSCWKKDKKTVIKSIDWSEIDGYSTIELLDFNPCMSVYPGSFSMEEEQLPTYLISWIQQNKKAEDFLTDLKVNTTGSLIVSLRKYFSDGTEFQFSRIENEGREDLLYNTLTWIKESQIKLKDEESVDIFKRIISLINNKRKEHEKKELMLMQNFDFAKMVSARIKFEDNSYLKWQADLGNKYSIFLFDGELPRNITLDEFDNYIFREYNEDDIAMSEENMIYINRYKKKELKILLTRLVEKGEISNDELLKLYQREDTLQVSAEEFDFLHKIKQVVGNDNLEEMIEIGRQAFANDGALINTGNLGEKIVYADLVNKFGKDRVKWTSSENPGVSNGTDEYDFEIYDKDTKRILYYVDAKSTTVRKYQTDKTEIYWRNSEWKFIEQKGTSNYLIARVFNVNSHNPDITYLKVSKEELRGY